jgi:predicted SprT family Zn-dependent metalloprotease
MDKEPDVSDPDQLRVADRVQFSYRGQHWTGTVAKKGRTQAHIVCDNQREFRVPYRQLSKIAGAAPHHVHTRDEQQRLQFNPGDKVSFTVRGTLLHGTLVRLNPARGHVAADDGKEYQVPYVLLTRREHNPPLAVVSRGHQELQGIAQLARALLARYQLGQWSFQFDHATKRAGCCHYTAHIISLSAEFAKRAPDEEIKDTILHEIAHAVVGKDHHHDAVWRAKAVEIGCTGRRCHDLQFTPPRYLMKCERGCWVGTAERRRRGMVCRRCRGKILYQTYTEERWNSERAKSSHREQGGPSSLTLGKSAAKAAADIKRFH